MALPEGAEGLLRELAPRVLGALVRRYRDFAAAEDAVQEALVAAAQQWPREGLPLHPQAWLIQVATRRMTDSIRRDAARRRREAESAPDPVVPASGSAAGGDGEDDALLLLFLCCHPALPPAAAIALTLRAVGGLTTSQIARAFLVPEPTMAQRISRAKQKIAASGEPFRQPTPAERPQRVRSVLHVLYLIFNEGYASSEGAGVQRTELAEEAIRLAREARRQLPDSAEAAGLLALMLLTHARRRARVGPLGELIPLPEQDRARWDQAQIAEGIALLTAALGMGAAGPYQLQAAIAALHDEAARAEETDWPQILALYDLLETMSDNPMVRLNRAVALAMTAGPAAGLAAVAALEAAGGLPGHHRVAAVRAHLLELAGDRAEAGEAYRLAASRTASRPERDYLMLRAARLESEPPERRQGDEDGRVDRERGN